MWIWRKNKSLFEYDMLLLSFVNVKGGGGEAFGVGQ